jgi:hypothetical protein
VFNRVLGDFSSQNKYSKNTGFYRDWKVWSACIYQQNIHFSTEILDCGFWMFDSAESRLFLQRNSRYSALIPNDAIKHQAFNIKHQVSCSQSIP